MPPTGMAGQIIQNKDRTVEMVHCAMELAAEHNNLSSSPQIHMIEFSQSVLCPPSIYICTHINKNDISCFRMIKLPKNKRKRKGHKISENLRTGNISSCLQLPSMCKALDSNPGRRKRKGNK